MGGTKSRGFAEAGGESRGHQGHTVGAVNSFYLRYRKRWAYIGYTKVKQYTESIYTHYIQ